MNHQPEQQPRSFEAPRSNRGAFVGIAALVAVVVGLLVVFGVLRGPDSQGAVEGELLSSDAAATSPGEAPVAAVTPPVPTQRDTSGSPEATDADLPESVASLLAQAEQLESEGNATGAVELLKQAAVALKTEVDQATADGAVALAEWYTLALDDIRADVAALGGTAVAAAAPTLEDRTPHPPPSPGEVRQMTIVELGNFPYDPDAGGVPADVEALEGMDVRLVGYMVPGYQTEKLREFTLVPDIYECCFGQPPGLEHTIFVKLPDGKSVSFYYGEVEVTGRLKVEEELRDGYVVNLFTVTDVTSVRATGK